MSDKRAWSAAVTLGVLVVVTALGLDLLKPGAGGRHFSPGRARGEAKLDPSKSSLPQGLALPTEGVVAGQDGAGFDGVPEAKAASGGLSGVMDKAMAMFGLGGPKVEAADLADEKAAGLQNFKFPKASARFGGGSGGGGAVAGGVPAPQAGSEQQQSAAGVDPQLAAAGPLARSADGRLLRTALPGANAPRGRNQRLGTGMTAQGNWGAGGAVGYESGPGGASGLQAVGGAVTGGGAFVEGGAGSAIGAGPSAGSEGGVRSSPQNGGPQLSRAQKEKFEKDLRKEVTQVRKSLTLPAMMMLGNIIKNYRPQVAKARKAIDQAKSVDEAIAYFTPHGGVYPHSLIWDDLLLYKDLILSGKGERKSADGRVLDEWGTPLPEGQGYIDLGLRSRLRDTDDQLQKNKGCLEDFIKRIHLFQGDNKMREKDLKCVQTAERALRRRSDPLLGFIPVINGARKQLRMERMKPRLDELKRQADEGDARAARGYELLKTALQNVQKPLKEAAEALKDNPVPGAGVMTPMSAYAAGVVGTLGTQLASGDAGKLAKAAKKCAADLAKLADSVSGFSFPPVKEGEDSVPLLLSLAIRHLDDAHAAFNGDLTHGGGADLEGRPLEGAPMDKVTQRAIGTGDSARALFAGVDALYTLEHGRGLPASPGTSGGAGGGATGGGSGTVSTFSPGATGGGNQQWNDGGGNGQDPPP